MDALTLLLIAVVIVVTEVLLVAVYVVRVTGSTKGLPAVGKMVAQIIAALMIR